jgi:hypothetical protein
MSNSRLELFQTAFQNFDRVPLVTPEKLDLFRVEYGAEIIAELKQLVDNCSPSNNKMLFSPRYIAKCTLR